MKFAIYFVVDSKYLNVALCQAINIIENLKITCHIFIQDENLNLDGRVFTKQQSRYSGRLFFHINEMDFQGIDHLPSDEKWPKIVYYRILVPKILNYYERLLYIDADVLVNGNIDYLINLDFSGRTLAAVHDTGAIGEVAPGLPMSRTEWLNSIGIKGSRYFNSGVLLINVKEWIKHNYNEEILKFYSKYRDTAKMWDQDFLNYFFQNDWIELSPKWNFQITLFTYGFVASFKPVIYHFTDGRKPWHWNTFDWDVRFIKIYKNLAQRAELSQNNFPKPHYRSEKKSLFKKLKIFCRKVLINFGFHIKISDKKIATWRRNRDEYDTFFMNSKINRYFADDDLFDFDTRLSRQVQPFFNGRMVVDGSQFIEQLP